MELRHKEWISLNLETSALRRVQTKSSKPPRPRTVPKQNAREYSLPISNPKTKHVIKKKLPAFLNEQSRKKKKKTLTVKSGNSFDVSPEEEKEEPQKKIQME